MAINGTWFLFWNDILGNLGFYDDIEKILKSQFYNYNDTEKPYLVVSFVILGCMADNMR